MKTTNEFENAFWKKGKRYIVGLDEAGRGPMAGPLLVAGVCFPAFYDHPQIYDSKKLSPKKRQQLFYEIIHDALEYHILIIEPSKIDNLNIYRATQMAMEAIVDKFRLCEAVLSDAMPLKEYPFEVLDIIKGDQKSVSIAAASIIAKVIRDHIMEAYDIQYPLYGFKNHKGYVTKKHKDALNIHGIIDGLYRESYAPVQQIRNRLNK